MRISLICPVYDTPPDLLRAAARSVLGAAQQADGVPDGIAQLILVDDASRNAATCAALAELAEADSRVLVLRNPRNAGPASARNLGMQVAIGDWVGFLDADDLWLPGHLERLCAVAAAWPDAAWIGSRHCLLNPDDGTEPAAGLPTEGAEPLAPGLTRHGGARLTALMLSNFWMHLGAMLVRRDVLLRAGGFAEGVTYGEDIHLMARLSVLAPLHYLDAQGYAWRRGRPSLTSNAARLRFSALKVHVAAARDPLLHGFARERRWARYKATKGLALNNLLAGNRFTALRAAVAAWLVDPREVGDLARFLSLWLGGTEGRDLRHYSQAEQFTVRSAT
ncbi:glycosyltransferase family 2 protein [Roseomonas frigidaquae]|uniref:Glycosyltransferase family 2 protein n=1 Tax=Falsiroseomonas frigidaquae TaxID=487318 RepID=A0ABX1EZB2_9PROT|nr:glycosyltransferase family 2 protein [Falsiroseomonas frigidaquae]